MFFKTLFLLLTMSSKAFASGGFPDNVYVVNTSANPVPITGSVTVMGSITVINASVGTVGSPVPSLATFIGFQNQSGNLAPVILTAAGALPVDGSAVTQPISATSLPLPTGAATNAELVTINSTLGSPFQAGGSIGNSAFGISGLLPAFASTPLVDAAQSGTWTAGRTWTLSNSTDSVNIGNFPATVAVTQSTSPWVISGSVSQSGTWNINNISGAISLPTGASTAANQATIIANQTNGTQETQVTNFPATQAVTQSGTWTVQQGSAPWSVSQSGTWNLNNITGTISLPTGAATNSELITINSTLGSPFQAGGSIGNTVFGATQSGTWTTGRTWTLGHSTDSIQNYLNDGSGNAITSQISGSQRALDVGINVAGVQVDPRTRTWNLSSGSDSVAAVQSGTWNIANITGTVSLPTGASTSANQSTEITALNLINTNLGTVIANQTNQTQDTMISDGGGRTLVIKAPSTAAAATDNSAVVALSPNSPLPAGSNNIGSVNQGTSPWVVSGTVTANQGGAPWSVSQSGTWTTGRTWTLASGTDSVAAVQSGTWNVGLNAGTNTIGAINNTSSTSSAGLSANGNLVAMAVGNYSSAVISIQGTFSATINFTGSNDGGTTYFPIAAYNMGNPGSGYSTSTTTTGIYYVPLDYTNLVVSVTGYASGTVNGYASLHTFAPILYPTTVAVTQSTSPWVNNISQINGTTIVTAGVSGLIAVGGNVASGSSDSGDPVKVGAKYNSTPISASNGQRIDAQASSDGSHIVASRFAYGHFSTATTVTEKTGEGILHNVCYNKPVNASSMTIYDNTAGSGTIIAAPGPPNGNSPFCYEYDIEFTTGLTIVTVGTADWTVSYR
jgi:hypothetical protein